MRSVYRRWIWMLLWIILVSCSSSNLHPVPDHPAEDETILDHSKKYSEGHERSEINIAEEDLTSIQPEHVQVTESLATYNHGQDTGLTEEDHNEPDVSLTEEEVLAFIEDRLSEDERKISSIQWIGIDENGNIIVQQMSKATTVIMEWYYIDPTTRDIICESTGDDCLDTSVQQSVTVIDDEIPPPEVAEALELAERYAVQYFSERGYLEDITNIVFDHMDQGRYVFQVYNPDLGHSTDTIDWLIVDLETEVVKSIFE